MDWSVFGLNRRPFSPTLEADLFLPTEGQKSVLADLRDAFEAGDEGAILTGEPGAGKTLLLHHFLQELPNDVSRILLPTGKYSKPIDLHQAILFDLGESWQHKSGLNKSEQETRLAVTEHIFNQISQGQQIVLAIDEAHHLHIDVLEELRMLGNLSKPGQRSLFVVLIGLNSLRDRLETPWLRAFSQRYRIHATMPILEQEEIINLLNRQLELCGSREPERILNTEAVQHIAELSQGIPRLANYLASTAFVMANQSELLTVDIEVVMEAANRLGINQETTELTQSIHSELSDGSNEGSLTIPPSEPESILSRPPKQRILKRQSA